MLYMHDILSCAVRMLSRAFDDLSVHRWRSAELTLEVTAEMALIEEAATRGDLRNARIARLKQLRGSHDTTPSGVVADARAGESLECARHIRRISVNDRRNVTD